MERQYPAFTIGAMRLLLNLLIGLGSPISILLTWTTAIVDGRASTSVIATIVAGVCYAIALLGMVLRINWLAYIPGAIALTSILWVWLIPSSLPG